MHISRCKFYGKSAKGKSILFAWMGICAISLFSCTTDFEVNAPYKELNEVYGLLEMPNGQQIIKIGKVFQNSTGVTAAQAAQNMDSLYQDSLNVTLTDDNSGAITQLYRFYNTQKQPGYFASPGQYLYATPISFVLNPADRYTLTIVDPKTNVKSQASTFVVNPAIPIHPYKGASINFIDDVTSYYKTGFGTGANAVTYDMNILIPIREYSKKDSTLIKTDTLVYSVFKTRQVPGVSITVQEAVQASQFYRFVGASLKVDPNVYRKMDSLDFEITGAATDLADYFQVNTPTQDIVQKTPTYTNISNGVGVFSSRYITRIKAPLTGTAYAILNSSQYTKGLNFVH